MGLTNFPAQLVSSLTSGLRRGEEIAVDSGPPELIKKNYLEMTRENQALWQALREMDRELKQYKLLANLDRLGQIGLANIQFISVRARPGHQGRLIIDKGSLQGLSEGLIVVSDANLVGRIVDCKSTAATVMLLTGGDEKLMVQIIDPKKPLDRAPQRTPMVLTPAPDGRSFLGECTRQAPIQLNHMAQLVDDRWPGEARGFFVGVVTEVAPDPNNPNFNMVCVTPIHELSALSRATVFAPAPPSGQEATR